MNSHTHRATARNNKTPAILIVVQTPADSDEDILRSLRELSMLMEDLDIWVAETVIQKRSHKNSASYLGQGKLKEVAALTGGTGMIAKGPDKTAMSGSGYVVIVDDEMTPSQQRNLQSALGVEVSDRVAVILKIFEKRAHTREAKLQIELAKLEYQLPRIKDDHALGDKEGGGGRASRGHTNVELSKQRIRHQIAELRREIERISPDKKRGVEDFQVALIGYTNAGKSSLVNALTRAATYVEDKLFATLGTTTKKMNPPSVPPIHLTDTVGFIEKLPHGLIASFRSTLAEARDAWLLMQVIDASDKDWRNHIKVTAQVLREIGLGEKACLLLFNKIDKVSKEERLGMAAEFPNALFTSAVNADDLMSLRQVIIDFQNRELTECSLNLTYSDYPILAEYRDYVQIVSEEFGETVSVKIRSTAEKLAMLKARLA